MKRIPKYFSLLLVVLVFMMMPGCKEESNPVTQQTQNTKNKIETEAVIDVGTTLIGTGGGTVSISRPGTPVDGMEIIVPNNAYTVSKSFSISYALIKEHQFGTNFQPVSPLITIKNGGEYSSAPLTVKIPIKKAADEFALGYLYNEASGTLEAIPLLAATDSTVTLSMSHFETSNLSAGKRLGKGSHNQASEGNIIISSLKESVLASQTIINTGYLPGVDDWEFINYGSYRAPHGHCAGQSMSSMWYYYEKKLKGSPSLFHEYDEVCTPAVPGTLWQDNGAGYRFASMVQNDFDWSNWILKVNVESYVPSLVWKAFIAAMLVTGEPQFVIIKESSTNNAHAMVVYKINVSEGKLYIADPNFPNNRTPDGTSSIRTITYTGSSFDPYPSSLNANSSQINFDQIAFFGKTANINWTKIGTRWTEFQNRTIGNGSFPAYDLMIKGAPPVALTDGIIINQDTLKVYCKSADADQYYINTDHWQRINIIDRNGNLLCDNNTAGPNLGLAQLVLAPGNNLLGFYIMGGKDNKDYYVDFKWLNVTLNKLNIASISPNHGTAGTIVTIAGTAFQPLQGSSYVQFNGIPTTTVSSWSDTLITVQVPQGVSSGDITVVVGGITSNGKYFTLDGPTNLNGLDLTTKVQVVIDGNTVIGQQTNITTIGIANTSGFSTVGSTSYPECPLTWIGTAFRVNGVHIRSTYQRDSIYISGTVSPDGETILSVDVAYRYYALSSTDGSLEDEETFHFTLKTIPSFIGFSFLTMTDPASRISNFQWRRWSKTNGEETGSFTSVSIVHVDFE